MKNLTIEYIKTNLVELRGELEITQDELAEITGIAQPKAEIAELDEKIETKIKKGKRIGPTRFVCPICSGSGCSRCDWKGVVSMEVAERLEEAVKGTRETVTKRLVREETLKDEEDLDPCEWHPLATLARIMGMHPNSIENARKRDGTVRRKYSVERRPKAPNDRRFLYRLVPLAITDRRRLDYRTECDFSETIADEEEHADIVRAGKDIGLKESHQNGEIH